MKNTTKYTRKPSGRPDRPAYTRTNTSGQTNQVPSTRNAGGSDNVKNPSRRPTSRTQGGYKPQQAGLKPKQQGRPQATRPSRAARRPRPVLGRPIHGTTHSSAKSRNATIPSQTQRQSDLRLIPLGGLGEVGRNMMILDYKGKYLLIDAGFRMPEEDMPGIDYLIPNTGWLKDKQNDIVGAVITHGHYDHIGAIPYCWHRLGNPKLFMGRLAKGIVTKRQARFPMQKKLDITEIKDGSRIKLGPFEIEFFKQNHNIPDNFGLLIKTPVGNIVHSSDFKFDRAPVNDEPTNFKKFRQIAKEKVMLFMCDSTGAENEGRSLSERVIFKNLEKIFKEAKGRIISSTFASHLNRAQQLIALAEKYNRKVILEGLSMKDNVEIARVLKYINTKKGTIVKAEQIASLPDNQVTVICTGAQGEERATMMKIANDEYRFLKLKKGDSIIFSSSVIPGNERSVQYLKDQFYKRGANVFHYQMLDIHASGHAYQEEIKEMIKIMRPQFFIPLHGQFSMMVKAKELAERSGVKQENALVVENGQILNITNKKAWVDQQTVPAGYVMVDGLGVGDVGEVVLRDRQTLAQDGMFVIIAVVDRQNGRVKGSPDIISRGFVYLRESKEMLNATRKKVIEVIERSTGQKSTANWTYVKEEVRNEIGNFLFAKINRRPMVLPVIIRV